MQVIRTAGYQVKEQKTGGGEQENVEFRIMDLEFRSFDPFDYAQGRLCSGQAPSTTPSAMLRTRHKRISAIASTCVLLQFQILFDGVEKSMNSSNRKISLDERAAHLV